jgi:hypothetical protein
MNRKPITHKRSRIIQKNQTYYTVMPGIVTLKPAWPAGVDCFRTAAGLLSFYLVRVQISVIWGKERPSICLCCFAQIEKMYIDLNVAYNV